jgi:hypothetical protein
MTEHTKLLHTCQRCGRQFLSARTQRLCLACRQAKDRQLELAAAEIRIRAERRLGALLAEMPKNRGMASGATRTSSGTFSEPLDTTPTLAAQGIDKKLSARSQHLAALPDDAHVEPLCHLCDNA